MLWLGCRIVGRFGKPTDDGESQVVAFLVLLNEEAGGRFAKPTYKGEKQVGGVLKAVLGTAVT